MTRLAVVSRNAALPFALNSAGHEVVVVDDEADVRWAEYGTAEIVVLDLDDPVASQVLVDDLAASTLTEVRVLLLASKNPGWSGALHEVRPGVAVLPLPLSLHRLNEALDTLARGPALTHVERPAQPAPPVAPQPQPEQPEQPVHAHVEAEPEPEPEPDPPSVVEPTAQPSSPAAAQDEPEPDDELDELVSLEQAWSEPEPAAPEHQPEHAAIGAASVMPATLGYYELRNHPAQEHPRSEPPVPADPVPVVTPPPPRAASLVRALSACVGDLSSVGDTCSVICSEALRVVPADAAAVLVRDGAHWRVGGGSELRPLEHRLVIDADHWLVRQVSDTAHGIILAGGDGRWAELYGVPLSGRSHLLAAPLLPVGAILLLCRDVHEFGDNDLLSLTELCDEGGHLLSDAVDVRRLARQLAPFLDSSE